MRIVLFISVLLLSNMHAEIIRFESQHYEDEFRISEWSLPVQVNKSDNSLYKSPYLAIDIIKMVVNGVEVRKQEINSLPTFFDTSSIQVNSNFYIYKLGPMYSMNITSTDSDSLKVYMYEVGKIPHDFYMKYRLRTLNGVEHNVLYEFHSIGIESKTTNPTAPSESAPDTTPSEKKE